MATEIPEPDPEMLKAIAAGDRLAAAAARVCAEYDGVHRLRAALSEWFDIRAGIHGKSPEKTEPLHLGIMPYVAPAPAVHNHGYDPSCREVPLLDGTIRGVCMVYIPGGSDG